MAKYHNIFLNLLKVSMSEMHLKSNTERTSHLELPRTEDVSLINGYATLYFAILTFKCLPSVTTLLSCVTFLLINITGLEYGENPCFIYRTQWSTFSQ